MFWVVLTVLAILVMGAALVTVIGSTGPGDRRDVALATLVITPLVWLVISVALSLHTVGQRQVGVVYNFSGTITGKVDPGIAWTMPWQHINKANVGIQREDFVLDAGNAASSKDLQPIFANLTLNYQVEPAKIIELYKTVGPGWKETLLDSRVLQDFKEVTASFSAAEITTARPQLRADTKQRLSEELKKYDIHVVDFFVKNLGYSETYRQSIDRKNVQVQAALQAQAKVAQATAEANQAIATARGVAQSVLVKARADAEANRLKRNSLTPLLVQNNAIDKLSDNVQIICTGTCPWLPESLLGK